MTFEVRVHEDLCMGVQACVEQAREIFIVGDDGIPVAQNYENADLDEMVQVAEQCPNRAISVVSDGKVLVEEFKP